MITPLQRNSKNSFMFDIRSMQFLFIFYFILSLVTLHKREVFSRHFCIGSCARGIHIYRFYEQFWLGFGTLYYLSNRNWIKYVSQLV